jgi:threonyl-tRNA synthetase
MFAHRTGFYYDFQRDTAFLPEDLEKIEKRCGRFRRAICPTGESTPRRTGRAPRRSATKVELITERAGDIF